MQGRPMPAGMQEAEPLPEPLFTPTTKADEGHDLPMTDAEAIAAVGADMFGRLRDAALAIYERGAAHAAARGIILADTKFEFGFAPDGELLLIDEVLTPDSSRYWPAEDYARRRLAADLRQAVRARPLPRPSTGTARRPRRRCPPR